MFHKYILYKHRDIAIIRWTNWIAYCNFSGDTDAANIKAILMLRKTYIKTILIDRMKFLK